MTTSASASEKPNRRSLLLQQRSQETRRKLIRAATRLWAANGYDETTVEEICTAAGVGRTTFYLHFESKEQLLGELTWATASGVAADVEATIGTGGLNQQVEAFISGLVRRMEGVPRSLTAFVLRHTGPGSVPPPGTSDRVLFTDTFAAILEDAQRRGEIRADVDTAELGTILGVLTMDSLRRWATASTSERDLRDTLQLRVELVLDGVRL